MLNFFIYITLLPYTIIVYILNVYKYHLYKLKDFLYFIFERKTNIQQNNNLLKDYYDFLINDINDKSNININNLRRFLKLLIRTEFYDNNTYIDEYHKIDKLQFSKLTIEKKRNLLNKLINMNNNNLLTKNYFYKTINQYE